MSRGPFTITHNDPDPSAADDGVQDEMFIWPQVSTPTSAADDATDDLIKDLDDADSATRAARLAGSQH